MREKRYIRFFQITAALCFGLLFSSCEDRVKEGLIIFTQSPATDNKIDSFTAHSWKNVPQSRIVSLDSNEDAESITLLSEDFYSACSPKISFDGLNILFTAQKSENDIWQIWEMNLSTGKTRQVTFSDEDCIDPAYLPGDRLLFSKYNISEKGNNRYSLYAGYLQGSDFEKITFNPNSYSSSTVLQDGRVLTISQETFPKLRDEMFSILRPDGTKEEMFYQNPESSYLCGPGTENDDGTIFFVEADKNIEGRGALISIEYNRPMNSRKELSSRLEGEFLSLKPENQGSLLVSYRLHKEENFGLYKFNIEKKILNSPVYKDENYHVSEIEIVQIKSRPRKLPSEVDYRVDTGLLLCQDVNFTGDYNHEPGISTSEVTGIELLGINHSMGKVKVEEDGSFYLKIEADTPFRIQSFDDQGNIVNGPSRWLTLRPNERRGCVGCHADNERVPDNRQPLSVLKEPVIVKNK